MFGYVNRKKEITIVHQNKMVFDGDPLNCMPPAANVSMTLTFDAMTENLFSIPTHMTIISATFH